MPEPEQEKSPLWLQFDHFVARFTAGPFGKITAIILSAAFIFSAAPTELVRSVVSDLMKLKPVTIAALISGAGTSLFVAWVLTGNFARRVFGENDYGDRYPLQTPKKETSFDQESAIDYYRKLSLASRSVAKTLFSRSGVFLVAGVLTAFSGIFLFLLARSFSPAPPKLSQNLVFEYGVVLLQNAGILLICELIAFFFLRQSRSVLDEFRYADKIARHREEVLALLLANGGTDISNLHSLVDSGKFFSQVERLANGESTELNEARKHEKTEVDILTKLVELTSALNK